MESHSVKRNLLRISGKFTLLSRTTWYHIISHGYSKQNNNFHVLTLNFKDDENDMPAYFKFMTIMAFYVFLNEKVDVAIFEVGIGGLYDCTNVIR